MEKFIIDFARTVAIDPSQSDGPAYVPGQYGLIWRHNDGTETLLSDENVFAAVKDIVDNRDRSSAIQALKVGQPAIYKDEDVTEMLLELVVTHGTEDDVVAAFDAAKDIVTARRYIIALLLESKNSYALMRVRNSFALHPDELQHIRSGDTERWSAWRMFFDWIISI